MGDSWQYVTPETKKFLKRKESETTAIRAKWFNDHVQQQRKSRAPPVNSSKWSLKSFILLAPWSSIVSWAFLISGLVMYGLNVSKLSTRTIHILDVTESDVSPYNKHLETIVSSNIISLILGLLSIVVGAIASWIHIKDILGGHSWGSVTRFIVNLVLSIGLIYLLACFAWFFIATNYVSSWCTGLWTLETACRNTAGLIKDQTVALDQECTPLCLNLRNYPVLNTVACVCNYESLERLGEITASARVKAIWVLAGASCIVIGLLISIINVSADIGCIHMPYMQDITKYDSEHVGTAEEHESNQKSAVKLPSITPGSTQKRSRTSV